MAKERVAVIGVGQTKHQATRGDVSMAGLVREAADRALADADVGWSDIDAVVIGKAPDFFEGVMMPELFLADALGAVGKPLLRVHTAGSVGGATANVAAKPAVTATATTSARLMLARSSSRPRKNERYAGSMAKPHGLTVATMPVVNASARSTSITR